MSARTRHMKAGMILTMLTLFIAANALDGHWDIVVLIAAWFFTGTQFPKLLAKEAADGTQ